MTDIMASPAVRQAEGPPTDAVLPRSLRSQGALRIGFERRGGATFMRDSYQSGCLRVRLPHRDEHDRPCAIMINTAGGLADGDSLTQILRWGAGSRATFTTQAAEKGLPRALLRMPHRNLHCSRTGSRCRMAATSDHSVRSRPAGA